MSIEDTLAFVWIYFVLISHIHTVGRLCNGKIIFTVDVPIDFNVILKQLTARVCVAVIIRLS